MLLCHAGIRRPAQPQGVRVDTHTVNSSLGCRKKHKIIKALALTSPHSATVQVKLTFSFFLASHNILEALRHGQHSSRFTAEKCEEVQMNHVTPVFPVQLKGPAGCSNCSVSHFISFGLLLQQNAQNAYLDRSERKLRQAFSKLGMFQTALLFNSISHLLFKFRLTV